jgi:hypothetical protein
MDDKNDNNEFWVAGVRNGFAIRYNENESPIKINNKYYLKYKDGFSNELLDIKELVYSGSQDGLTTGNSLFVNEPSITLNNSIYSENETYSIHKEYLGLNLSFDKNGKRVLIYGDTDGITTDLCVYRSDL